uniref:Reverse transcriptase n=1 Tax=Ophiocordycipitaceae sp. TaxID=1907519 RepID=A0A7S8HP93_9HYPO|nr:hypothetical protein [Ophiocordycipitaceae sp.]QUT09495.1 hypothetical protein [Ophiocordycipitaceae sp.]QUT09523.1 hypothetical protein [Ophiocordycipitaceae sp.]QUT13253.1 hypothetical protein [Ophiocordycipitaceae sp.]DAJ12175.1 TPA_asm: reverse transcriptase [Ophiocordycipitaceae sp.]
MKRVSKIVKCHRTLELIKKSFSGKGVSKGTPRGSVLSRLLSNIVLHELDTFVEEIKSEYTSNAVNKGCMYIRYGGDFVILVAGTYCEASNIRTRVKDLKCGLELNLNNILNVKDGFKFLGAHCRTLNSDERARMRVDIDIRKVYKKLVSARIAKYDKYQIPRGTARNDLINNSHGEIVAFYNSEILRLWHRLYPFRPRLQFVFLILKSSCALTLAKKYKLRTQGAIYKKYGKLLKCPETGIEIVQANTLKRVTS